MMAILLLLFVAILIVVFLIGYAACKSDDTWKQEVRSEIIRLRLERLEREDNEIAIEVARQLAKLKEKPCDDSVRS